MMPRWIISFLPGVRICRTAVLGAVAVAGMLLVACQPSDSSGPGGTDFPNTRTVAGRILHEDGTPAPFTAVRLVPENFVPRTDGAFDTLPVDVTDSGGWFAISTADSGTCNLTALNQQKGTRLLLRKLSVAGDDTILAGDRVLLAPGAIAVALPESLRHIDGFLYVKGTGLRAAGGKSDSIVIIDSVPAGTVPAVRFSRGDGTGPDAALADSAVVAPSDTLLLAPQRGRFSLRLFLNTTSDGADIADDVLNVPVAIRLGKLPVDLAGFAPGGTDLRVTRPDNTPLPCRIEVWEPDRAEALAWVKIDTVYGNRADQSIYLFWGNTDAATRPDAPVFDTSDGFSAVWHLSGGYTDATANGRDGSASGGVTDTVGILGGAHRFHGNGSITIPGLLDSPSTVTISAWARLDTADSAGADVISIGDAALIRMDDGWRSKGCQGSFHRAPSAPDSATHEFLGSGLFLAGTGWHHLAYVYDRFAAAHRLFVDGDLYRESGVASPIRYDSVGTETRIGTHGNGKFRNFTGAIDEVRVAHVARSAAWIKLCYMNQRADDRLVGIRR